jgi:hypothetical protein
VDCIRVKPVGKQAMQMSKQKPAPPPEPVADDSSITDSDIPF